MSPPIIRTRGLTKRFGDFTAVSDLSIEVMPGTIFAFLGANGSGKSTTIRMLIGLLRPSAGTVEVDGIDVIRRPRRVRDHIGYMGQKVSLYKGLTLRENVEFYAGLYGLAGAELEQRWGALCERFALGEAEAEKPEDLPAGIRQRAGLALATLHRPRVLLLDEPTAGVDVRSRGSSGSSSRTRRTRVSRSSSPPTSSRRSSTATGRPSSTPGGSSPTRRPRSSASATPTATASRSRCRPQRETPRRGRSARSPARWRRPRAASRSAFRRSIPRCSPHSTAWSLRARVWTSSSPR